MYGSGTKFAIEESLSRTITVVFFLFKDGSLIAFPQLIF